MLPVTAGRGTSRGQAGVWVSGYYYYYYYWLVKGIYTMLKKMLILAKKLRLAEANSKWEVEYKIIA